MKLYIVGLTPYLFIKNVHLITCIYVDNYVRMQFEFFCMFNSELEHFCTDVLNERKSEYNCQGQSFTTIRYNNRQLQINKYFFTDVEFIYIPVFIQDLVTQKTISVDEYSEIYIKHELNFFQ